MSQITPIYVLQSRAGTQTVVGHDFQSTFTELALSKDADVAIVSTEEGFSPLGESGNFFEQDLGISYDEIIRPLARWNQDVNESVTLIALASRRPNSLLRGIILAPGENCRSYDAYQNRFGRSPHRDYYYNVSYEAINYACQNWGARKIAISHLSGSGRFHKDMATCQVEALAHYCDAAPVSEPVSFTYCGCCVDLGHFDGIRHLNDEPYSTHSKIKVTEEANGLAVKLHLNWQEGAD